MKKAETISNENLGNVSGGSTVEMTYYGPAEDYIFLSPEEYDILLEAGYIDENNKINYRNSYFEIKRCLQNHGYDFDLGLDTWTIKHSSDLTPIKIVE